MILFTHPFLHLLLKQLFMRLSLPCRTLFLWY
jgi:hypothetical protein